MGVPMVRMSVMAVGMVAMRVVTRTAGIRLPGCRYGTLPRRGLRVMVMTVSGRGELWQCRHEETP